MEKKPILGRGLASLIPLEISAESINSNATQSSIINAPTILSNHNIDQSQHAYNDNRIIEVSISNILIHSPGVRLSVDAEQMQDLMQSISQYGILQPVLLQYHSDGQYSIIAGTRRVKAAIALGMATVPALVKYIEDHEKTTIALIENLQRQDLNPIEEALAYQQLLEENSCTQEQISQKIGKSRAHIANTVRLLQLPESVQHLLQTGQISYGHARALINCKDAEELAHLAASQGLSVRQIENQVRKNAALPAPQNSAAGQHRSNRSGLHNNQAQTLTSHTLGVKMEIMAAEDEQSGKLIVYFDNMTQLDKILESIG